MPEKPSSAAAATFRRTRRRLLVSSAFALFAGGISKTLARTIGGNIPWTPFAAAPPQPAPDAGWVFFTAKEAAAVEAIVERLIPADELSPSGKEAGCAVFIDRQLAGPFGDSRKLYMEAPFHIGTPTQGPQSGITPAERYRKGLAALDAQCREAFGGKNFVALAPGQRDELLHQMEERESNPADPADPRSLFELLLQNTMEGFFADPIYGGNREMAGWKMIGFPGYRYDYRNYVRRYNEAYGLPPLSIGGRPAWHAGTKG
jgi:gluconate 2-dehydrogenase gamma chain